MNNKKIWVVSECVSGYGGDLFTMICAFDNEEMADAAANKLCGSTSNPNINYMVTDLSLTESEESD